ncbi:MAG: hypothetical protein HRU29_03415 [Rhizobiales bacterium]|nr:methylmalonyl-CoA mutase family protein [Hyphomicrobiales bacterium]NRB13428.1 hypothetical protein [Hyphomicrobiales bacterium]
MSNNGFENIKYDDWLSFAKQSLKTESLDHLAKTTLDGIVIQPLYIDRVGHQQPALPHGGWQVNQAINHPDVKQAHRQILQDLEQGVNGLSLYSNQCLNARGYGVNLNQVNFDSLFENIYLEMISLRLESGLDEFECARLAEAYYTKQGYFAKGTALSLGIDPIGKLALYGGWDDENEAKQQVQTALNTHQALHILRADGRIAHNAGASEAQELAFALSSALTYLKWADEAGIDLSFAAQKIEICLAASQSQFLTMAKFRAMRHLWAELLDGLNIQPSDAYIFAETSYRMSTKSDPWVNLLRTTIGCFAAGVGGANQISILPLSAAIGLAPAFDRRMARHIQTILMQESHIADVNDPSHGSFYIETLTHDLTAKAWALFQNMQKSGGVISGLIDGSLQLSIAQVAKKTQQNLADKTQILVGTSEFINADEKPYEVLDVDRFSLKTPNFTTKIKPLTPLRDSEMFETASEAAHV